MTAEEKKKIIENSFDHMRETLKGVWLPINVGDTTVGETTLRDRDIFRIATALTNEGFFLERSSCWANDEYDDYAVVCNACYGKALTNPEEPDKIMYTAYCPHCGAKMNTKEND